MTNGIIDSSTLYELIHLFRERRVAETSAWTWRCSSEVTCALIHGRQLGLAHTPKLGLYPGMWGYIQRHLTDQVQLAAPSIQTQRLAHATTDNWAISDEGIGLLRRSISPAYYQAKSPYVQRSFARYQENMIVHTWPVLVGPHEIFEKHNIRAISRVLDISQRELRRVHRSSKDARMLRQFAVAPSFDDELFGILWNAYLVDLLIRGRYHDEAARLQGGQVLHHPARGPILRRLSGKNTEYDVTSTDRALANIILAGALAERTQPRRMDLWLEGILKARKAAQYGSLSFADDDDDKAAEKAAAKKARELGIRTHPSLYDDVTDASIAIGAGVLTSFVLSGWIDVAISVGMYAAAKSKQLGSRAGDLIYERHHRLERFAASGSGRIEREWSQPADMPGGEASGPQ
jgi:hypothetical protein